MVSGSMNDKNAFAATQIVKEHQLHRETDRS